MHRILALIVVSACCVAQEQQVTLDPSRPVDAVQVIDLLTRSVSMTRADGEAFRIALATLEQMAKAADKPTPTVEPKAPTK